MSGHSKWAGIKHKKAALDKKRGKLWTKISREISMAAKLGGGVLENNPRLRKAVDDAKAANMPNDNIKRAIQKGTGELPGASYEELTIEGYGPAGVAVYCDGTTDNRNRTTNELRKLYEDHGGSMGQPGSVAYLFERKGYLTLPVSKIEEDKLLEIVLEAGGEDLKTDEDAYEITTDPLNFDAVRDALKAKEIEPEVAEITMLPKTRVPVPADKAENLLKLVDALEDYDDISNVYSNAEIPDEVLQSLDR